MFSIYVCDGHLGHVTCTIYKMYINFLSPFPRRRHIKFGLDWILEKKVFENGGHIHVYSPGTGADNLRGSNIFISTFIQSILSNAASFSD